MPHNLPPLSDVLDVTRPTSDEQLLRFWEPEDALRRIFPYLDTERNRAKFTGREFQAYNIPNQIEWFVNQFMQRIYGQLPGENGREGLYHIRPECTVYLSPGLDGHTESTRGRIAVPMCKIRVDTAELPSADPRQLAPARTWVLCGPLQRHYAFPGPALLPNSAGGWTPNAQAFALGHWAGIPARPYMLTAAGSTHPHASANTALRQALASRAFVAGGACGVSWTLLNPEAYRNAEHLPDSVHWHLEFEIETPEGGQRRPYVKRYFEIEFRRDLRAVQDEIEEREMLARGQGGGHSSVAREMGRGQEAAGQRDRRMAACWPEARQVRQW